MPFRFLSGCLSFNNETISFKRFCAENNLSGLKSLDSLSDQEIRKLSSP